jgi:hypothetical protein
MGGVEEIFRKELKGFRGDGKPQFYNKTVFSEGLEYSTYMRVNGYFLIFGACVKKYYGSRKKFSGETWVFSSYPRYMLHEAFADNLETGAWGSEILYERRLSKEEFCQVFIEFAEWFNQVEDNSLGVLEVVDLVRAYFPTRGRMI